MQQRQQGLSRRDFMKAVGLGALGTVATGGLAGGLSSALLTPTVLAATTTIALAATDGYITMPTREDNPIYVFGFIPVDPGASVATLSANYKGHAQHTAPILSFKQNDDVKVTLTNLGLVQRPDLTDSHTIHWHGFDIPSPLNDGVPEVSVAVPIGKQLTYFYRPHREGTYMYHCHFEDVEHVHMGMTSIVFVRPVQDNGVGASIPKARQEGGLASAPLGYAYNDGVAPSAPGSTAYDRHYAILENEIWAAFHDHDRDIQETIMTNYDPEWFTLNGRCYPQTILPNDDPATPVGWLPTYGTTSGIVTTNTTLGTNDKSQPNSALIQANAGERVLLRLANLGYRQNSMELPGIPMHVIGQDASLLRNGTTDTSYWTNNLYIGPGEARDVIFTAPAFNAALPSGGGGAYNVYYFKNRDWRKLSNNGTAGAGGMMTEVRVYPAGTLPLQTVVNQTF